MMKSELQLLAEKHGTDKASFFASIYWSCLKELKNRPVKLLEIGIKEGASLRLWREFFPSAEIHGADIRPVKVEGVSCHPVDQGSRESIRELLRATGGDFDIVIDDGSHMMSHQIHTFLEFFPALKPDGLYFVEDTHTSYMPYYQDARPSMMDFLGQCVNHLMLRGSHICDRGGYGQNRGDPAYCEHEFALDFPFRLLEDVGSIQFFPRLALITRKPGGWVPGCRGRG